MSKRLLSVLLVMAMLLCCLAACGDNKKDDTSKVDSSTTADDGAESVDESSAAALADKFNSITDNREKLVYFSGTPLSTNIGNKIENAVGSDVNTPEVVLGDKVKLSGSFNVSELSYAGEDLLSLLGGELGASLSLLTDGDVINMDGAIKAAGVSVDANVAIDENGLLITSPFVLNKPIYFDLGSISGLASSELDFDIEAVCGLLSNVLTSVAEYVEANFTEENARHFQEVIISMLPEDKVSSEIVKLEGEYTGNSVEAECVALTLDIESCVSIITSFRSKLYEDAAFKKAFVGFIECYNDVGYAYGFLSGEALEKLDAENAYEQLFEAFDELASELDGKEIEADDSWKIVVKRYFVNGVEARLDFEIDDGIDSVSFSCWDFYSGNTNDYGFIISDGDDTILDIVGGYNSDKSSLKIVGYVYEDVYEEDDFKVVEAFSLDFKKESNKITLDFHTEDVAIEFDYDGANYTFVFTDDGKTAFSVKGTYSVEGDTATLTGKLLDDNGTEQASFACATTVTVTDTKISVDVALDLNMNVDDSAFSVKADADFVFDVACTDDIVVPESGNGALVIDENTDLENISYDELLTEAFVQIISSFAFAA